MSADATTAANSNDNLAKHSPRYTAAKRRARQFSQDQPK